MGKSIDMERLSRFLTKITGRILTTKEQVLANTKNENFAGATAVKAMYNELNSNLIYSTSETVCGTWNGASIYRKIIKCNALPNNSSLYISHGIRNQDLIVKVYGTANDPSRSVTIPLPYAAAVPTVTYIDGENIVINTKNDMSSYSRVYIIIEYTKA